MNERQHHLVVEHLWLARHIVQCLGRGAAREDRDERFGWAFLALVEAAARFDPRRGVRFSTFAHARIKGAVLDALRRERRHRAMVDCREDPLSFAAKDGCQSSLDRIAWAWVVDARASLPNSERNMLSLMVDHQLGVKEASRRLGISSSWGSRLHRQAIRRLREAV
ncbi:MAG: sigma-70 family RNA polymerase sigma factor [Myxococcota bacterium]